MVGKTELLGRQEAADFLEVSTRTLDRYVRDRKLNYRRQKGKLYFEQKDLENMKLGREAHNPHLVTEENAGINTPVVSEKAAEQKYKILWEASKTDLEQKERLLLDLHQRLGFLESELKHSVPLLESQNARQEVEKKAAQQHEQITLLKQKLQYAQIGKMTLLALLLFVLSLGFLLFLWRVVF